jgi:hypothetical protein
MERTVKENGGENSNGGSRELLQRNLICKYYAVSTFVESPMSYLRDGIGSAHDVARFLK